jgi:hypothetical protein
MAKNIDIATFVVHVAYPFSKLHIPVFDTSEDYLQKAIRFSAKNKVFPLFYKGCQNLNIRLPEEAEKRYNEYEKRSKAQKETVKYLLGGCDRANIDVLFIKTFKPFKYIPDDIDVLLRRPSDLACFRKLLEERGFSLLKVGTPEVTMRKLYPGTFVDVDVHTSMSIGHVVLFDVEDVWRRSIYTTVEDGLEVPMLPDHFEIVRESAYSLLKDFKITIPALYSAEHAFLNNEIPDIWKVAEDEHFGFDTYLFLSTAHKLARIFLEENHKFGLDSPKEKFTKLALNLIELDLNKQQRAPYSYPALVIALAYFVRTLTKIRTEQSLEPLAQLLKQPSSKGIDILIEYARNWPSVF